MIPYCIFTVLVYGAVEGITEWLPISSTGHLILLNEILHLPFGSNLQSLFDVVIQFFSILAVFSVYFNRLNPVEKLNPVVFSGDKINLWKKIIIAVIPSAIVGFFFGDVIEKYLFNAVSVALMLILYGIIFLFAEKIVKFKEKQLSVIDSAKIGMFQVLALFPGTSRSGATILGGIFCGLRRKDAAEFSFFMALPTMLGASILKIAKYIAGGYGITPFELFLLFIGGVSSYFVSLITVRYLLAFLNNHSFRPFGIYRILLGAAVLFYYYFERN